MARPMAAGTGMLMVLMVMNCAWGQYYGQNAQTTRGPAAVHQESSVAAPAEPAAPSVPAAPAVPSAPAVTSAPAEPAAPATPVAPATPSEPAPAQPAASEEPALSQPAVADEAVGAVAKASNSFSRDLYQKLRSEPGNLVISPLSAAGVLALAWTGAGGRTAEQLQKVLHLPGDHRQVAQGYRGLFSSLQLSQDGLRLDAANRVFVRRGLGLQQEFQRKAEDAFLAGAEELDFARPAEAAGAVNTWVRDKTRGKIEELIKPDALSEATAMVLANAIYFKGTWLTKFDSSRTVVKPFRTSPPRNVSLMSTTGDFKYAHLFDLRSQALLLPYAGDRVSMLVLLPDALDGLPQLEEALAAVDVNGLLQQLRTEEVYVWLPRFSIRTSLTLNDALVQLGLSDVFTSMANFSGIATEGAFLSTVVQKAVIDVNEEGSEAAAASGGIFLLSAGLYNFFRADHPFVFYLLDRQSGTVLFQGRFSEPE